MGVRVAVAVLPILVGGCGTLVVQDASGGPGGGASENPSAVSAPSATRTVTERRSVHGLTCRSEMRSDGILDYISSAGGTETPQKAARVLARPQDDVVIRGRNPSGATAFLLRPNGTAHTRLGLVVLDDETWRVETVESCAGVRLFGR